MDAGIYVRISLDVEGEGKGVARQREDCTAKAKALGWNVAGVYEDNDVSASKDVPRPAYTRMLADLEAGTINAVVVYDLDRLTRKPAELESFIDLADRKSISLANVSGDVDLTNPNGRMIARIKGAVARQEAERIGQRVQRQKQQRAQSGIPHKGRHRMYGYDGNWNVIESEAAIMREAFKRRAAGESTTSIANDFKKRGIKNVSGRDWTSGTLGVTLTKDVYAGWVTFKGERVAESTFPAIVTDDVFQLAQTNLANDSKGTNTRKYLLSGILLCAHCLSPMKGNPSSKMYRCSTTYGGCGRLSVRIEAADKVVKWAAMQKANSKPQEPTAPVRDFKAEAKELEDSLSKYQEGFQAGIYTLAEAQPQIAKIRAALKELTKEEAKSVKTVMPWATRKYFDYHGMNLSQQRVFITEYINQVVVYPATKRGKNFDTTRLEAHYADGVVERIEPDMD